MKITLTKREQAVVLKAAKRIAEGTNHYSCIAIDHADNKKELSESPITVKYRDFYNPTVGFISFWYFEGEAIPDRETRVLMLLWFLEVCSE